MVDPVGSASNWFLGFWSALPPSFQWLVYLAVGLFVITTIVHIVFR